MAEDVLQARVRGKARVMEATAASLRVEADRLERQARQLRRLPGTADDKETADA
jgi:hypothetical protein